MFYKICTIWSKEAINNNNIILIYADPDPTTLFVDLDPNFINIRGHIRIQFINNIIMLSLKILF